MIIENAFRNYGSVSDGNEGEVLIPDYILPSSIVTTIDPNEFGDLDVRYFMDV